ncbi:NAD(P)-binding protein [Streptomyces sp. NPDC002911]
MVQHALSVAIVGAGIGGLAAAISLSRVGCQVTVYEQTKEFRETGTGLHLGPNGSRLSRSWGLRDALEEVAVRPPALEVRHWKNGETLVRRPMGQDWEEEYGATGTGPSARDEAAVAAALRRYEEIRRPHTRSVQTGSRGSGTLRLSSVPQAVDAGQDGSTNAALGRMVEDVSWIHAYDVTEALRDAATATEVLAARS